MSVVGVGLAVVAGVEEPDPGCELGWHVDDVFTVFEEPLCGRTPGPVASFDGPDPVHPGLRVAPHRCVAGAVGGEPPRAEQPLALIDDLDSGRQHVGIDPDNHALRVVAHVQLPPVLDPMVEGEVGIATTSRAVPS